METKTCYHCGEAIDKKDEVVFDDKSFCCTGCKTVYEIFSENGLACYYDFESAPGKTPQALAGKFDFLKNKEIATRLLEFNEDDLNITSIYIPHIHCSSCIWILENLNRLNAGISSSRVDFSKKEVRVVFNPKQISLYDLALLLSSIGYEPYISLDDYEGKGKKTDRSLIYRLGIAFFCFGNIMLLSFPEYFEVEEYWLDSYKGFFRWLVFGLSLPSFLYSASIYYKSAWKSLRAGILNIDVPIALGLIVMFVRSAIDIAFNLGPGFFDSLTGLVFFMLLGRLFQQKTYKFLSFERDFRSYFPIAVTKVTDEGREESVPVYDVQKGDRLIIRNSELIPVDAVLLDKTAKIDYSFVTGEAEPITKTQGEKLFAGGRQSGPVIMVKALAPVSQSYLTQLWSNEVFAKKDTHNYKTLTDTISRYFTPVLLAIAAISVSIWVFIDLGRAFSIFTAVLIVACPCALALSAPFTLGNVLRIMGNKKLYLKDANVVEKMAKIDTIVFDKTGTITTNKKSNITYDGEHIDSKERAFIKSLLRGSNHPLSRRLYDYLPEAGLFEVKDFKEVTGKGISGYINGFYVQAGSAAFIGAEAGASLETSVYIALNRSCLGRFVFENHYREGMQELFEMLSANYEVKILSGDNEGERAALVDVLPKGTEMVFNQKPEQKLAYIENLQKQGKNVMMVGDGLNDAGALAQSNVGISVSENINVFSPACDGILDASQFKNLGWFLRYSKNAVKTIKMSFVLSLLYNVVGLSFAVTGGVKPLTAAIIMPLSTITIVSFVTLMSNYYARKKVKVKAIKPSTSDYKYSTEKKLHTITGV
ncbi:heavy metal translocating P-type ATPase [Flavobacterium rhizosphaerae]|uniref:Heavy metal translocating P-type ATPase metal-binding domain-containing protein n=1 Tax=Flavobacterium rhizosphaerae TaxID=3163298 RepID=A0ABW8YTC8_9FLAO